jgi:hypothetical protein
MAWEVEMRRKAPKVGFSDMPEALRELPLDVADEQVRAAWLGEHGLTFVDFISWRRSALGPSRAVTAEAHDR